MSNLAEHKGLAAIQLIRAVVQKWWRLELAFADERGYVVDHADGKIFPSTGNEFCRLSLFSKDGFKRCNESVRVVRDRLRSGKNRPVFVHQCHLGFDIVAAPIHVNGKLEGFLFTGGAYHSEPPMVEKRELLRKVKAFEPEADINMDVVGRVPRLGADDLGRLCDLIQYGAQQVSRHIESEHDGPVSVEEKGESRSRFVELIGNSQAMAEVCDLLDKVSRSHSTVLIHGESGTGKELIAKAIHNYGPRAKQAFVVQNCSAFNDNLLESALFGHVRGSFTGAVKDQKGLFELADRGTFFLDEIGDMSPSLQVKLLRVLQEGTFTPVGANQEVRVDVRIIAASHKDLEKMVERREFREDLFYRINVLKVDVPPLRDRLEDLQILVDHFLLKHHHGEGDAPRVSAEVLSAMANYNWPGNIRELENEIERLMVLGVEHHVLPVGLLSPRVRSAGPKTKPESSATPVDHPKGGTLRETLESVEAQMIAQGLIRTHWNKSQLAKELGISRSNLIQKCSHYGLEQARKARGSKS